jgi:hypothetical protein
MTTDSADVNFGRRQSLDVAQDDDGPIVRRKRIDRRCDHNLDLLARPEGESAGELLRADADEAELAVPGILAVVEEGQE